MARLTGQLKGNSTQPTLLFVLKGISLKIKWKLSNGINGQFGFKRSAGHVAGENESVYPTSNFTVDKA